MSAGKLKSIKKAEMGTHNNPIKKQRELKSFLEFSGNNKTLNLFLILYIS